ncbi:ParB/RepB/Spo0J family partition protein [Burkholderia pseudomallei]|uniref:ParB/RepB/Spo0J family partition protein n=1 Tax=Burkholderia pseudomallei TaxID=28450 RepID=UPI000F0497AE|nr:ParB N-terminal domain-containing protein [Burkholderia pseudomallei]VBF20417.1 ParB-like partition protein [Burkholderia pseudomallei]
MDARTQPLALVEPIVTGNAKAAAAAAGATSADLWMVPYEQLHYDPRDNVRPVDQQWVSHLTALMIANGYDRSQPLHCYVRKVDGKDLIYVYKGQHRYLSAGNAIRAGKDLGKIPVVVRDAKTVERAEMVIDGYVSNESKRASPLDLATVVAELRDVHGLDTKTICKRLNVTDQTIRDVGLLEQAPAEIHQFVRDGSISGTLVIEQIRRHGAERTLERIVSSLSKAKDAGKTKVTKKHLHTASPKSVAAMAAAEPQRKIGEQHAKQLLQALQSVLHDPGFGKLSPGTIAGVHRALTGFEDLLDAVPTRRPKYPIAKANEHGVYEPSEILSAPISKRTGRASVEIRLAQIAEGDWEFGFSYAFNSAGGSSPCKRIDGESPGRYRTRVEAIRAAAQVLTRTLESTSASKAKEMAGVRRWLDKLFTMPDPDWTPEMAREAAQ